MSPFDPELRGKDIRDLRKRFRARRGTSGGTTLYVPVSAAGNFGARDPDKPAITGHNDNVGSPLSAACPNFDCATGKFGAFALDACQRGTSPVVPSNLTGGGLAQPITPAKQVLQAYGTTITHDNVFPVYSSAQVGPGELSYAFYQRVSTGPDPNPTVAVPTAQVCNSDCGRVILDLSRVSGTFQAGSVVSLRWRSPAILSLYNSTDTWPTDYYGSSYPYNTNNGQSMSCGNIAPSAPLTDNFFQVLGSTNYINTKIHINWGARVRLLACSYADAEETFPNISSATEFQFGGVTLSISGIRAFGPNYWECSQTYGCVDWSVYQGSPCGDDDGGLYDVYLSPVFFGGVSIESGLASQSFAPSEFGSPGNVVNVSNSLVHNDNAPTTTLGQINPYFTPFGSWFFTFNVVTDIIPYKNWDYSLYQSQGLADQPTAFYAAKSFPYTIVVDNMKFSYSLEYADTGIPAPA